MTKMGMDRLEELVKRHGKWVYAVHHYRLPDFTDARMINPDLSHLGLDRAIFKETYMAYANFPVGIPTEGRLYQCQFGGRELCQGRLEKSQLYRR